MKPEMKWGAIALIVALCAVMAYAGFIEKVEMECKANAMKSCSDVALQTALKACER